MRPLNGLKLSQRSSSGLQWQLSLVIDSASSRGGAHCPLGARPRWMALAPTSIGSDGSIPPPAVRATVSLDSRARVPRGIIGSSSPLSTPAGRFMTVREHRPAGGLHAGEPPIRQAVAIASRSVARQLWDTINVVKASSIPFKKERERKHPALASAYHPLSARRLVGYGVPVWWQHDAELAVTNHAWHVYKLQAGLPCSRVPDDDGVILTSQPGPTWLL
jgi:hypothetical protein